MGFLDNSGDIILDAVLTDTGRKRLARGDGSFKVAKFAFADDEINYGLYDKNNASGSAYYDINILQTPVLEAFTNNASSMKSKLITISRTNLLYLPVIKLNETNGVNGARNAASGSYHLVAVDKASRDQIATRSSAFAGLIDGYEPQEGSVSIVFDQGLDTTGISADSNLDADLVESQYIIQMDHRLGSMTNAAGVIQAHSFIDDDNIATYYITSNTDSSLVNSLEPGTTSPLAGPRGSRLMFRIKASLELESSTFLFEQIGLSSNVKYAHASDNYQVIDTIVRIQGATTGYSVELPIRYIKYTS